MIREPSAYERNFFPTGEDVAEQSKIVEEKADPRETHRKTVERENIIKLGDPLFQRIDLKK